MRKTALLLTSMALAVLLACGVALVAVERSAQAAFPGTNGKIVFVEFKDEQATDSLKLINQNGSGLVTLLESPYLSDPATSPDGTRVAYTKSKNSNAEIYMINTSSGRVRQLTNNAFNDSDPTWSPDGTRMAFVRTHFDGIDVEQDILIMRVDGTGATVNVTNTPNENESNPAWSPNGETIAFSQGHDDIVVQNLASGQRRNLTDDGSAHEDFSPNWSPDGIRLVFQSITYHGRPDCEWSGKILTIKASDGSDRRPLAGACSDGNGNGLFVNRPAYSPDGKQITFVKIRSDFADDIHRRQLMRMNASTGANKQLFYKVIGPGFYPLFSVPDWGVKVQD